MSAPFHPLVSVVVMGVSATGKSTIARELADQLGLDFVEGDDYHSPANLDKMAKGEALTDEDRVPWLQELAAMLELNEAGKTSSVLTCSALRRSYRDILRSDVTAAFFVQLHAEFDVLLERMQSREKHFMPPSLLSSQFDTLEPLEGDEAGAVIDVAKPLSEVVEEAVRRVRAVQESEQSLQSQRPEQPEQPEQGR